MNQTQKINPCIAFASFADTDLQKWKQIEGQQTRHTKEGLGTIVKVDTGKTNQENLYLSIHYDDVPAGNPTDRYPIGAFRTGKYFDYLDIPFSLSNIVDKYAKEIQRKVIQKELIEVIREFDALLVNPIKVVVPHPRLTHQDIRLALAWSHTPELTRILKGNDINTNVVKECFSENRELGRILSARVAEIATIDFYRKNNYKVEDISSTQIESGNNGEWRNYDLSINSASIDVKNARRSRHNKNHLVITPTRLGRLSSHTAVVAIANILH